MKMLLYSCKTKPYLVDCRDLDIKNKFRLSKNKVCERPILNGKIVAECDFEIEEIKLKTNSYEAWFETKTLNEEQLREKSCLRVDELYNYLEPNDNGYAIHIKNLHIFDEPRDLSYYYTYGKEGWKRIEKAPQNMMYAYELLNFSDWRKNSRQYFYRNAVISIQPQWMCLILNHIKDVEVRKVVLKGMLS